MGVVNDVFLFLLCLPFVILLDGWPVSRVVGVVIQIVGFITILVCAYQGEPIAIAILVGLGLLPHVFDLSTPTRDARRPERRRPARVGLLQRPLPRPLPASDTITALIMRPISPTSTASKLPSWPRQQLRDLSTLKVSRSNTSRSMTFGRK